MFTEKKRALLRLVWLTLLFPLLLLTGCETVGSMTKDASLSFRTVRKCGTPLALSGRVSMHYVLVQDNRTESLHGKFTWQQHDDHTFIRLFSPLGQAMAVIDVTPQQAVFTASGKPPVGTANVDELVFQQLGWPLPVSGLRYWLEGCAADSGGNFLQASPDHPEIVTQDGWHIRYVNWMSIGESELVPRRIDLSHTPPPTATVHAIHIRLVVDEWEAQNGKSE